jgi:hypothetical protein
MIIDHKFSDAQSLATASSATACTNVLDIGVAGQYIHDAPFVVCQVETAFACAGSNPTLTVQFVESANADLSSPTVLWTSGAVAEATLVDKYQICKMRLPKLTKQYCGFLYTPSAAFDSGKLDAVMALDADIQ